MIDLSIYIAPSINPLNVWDLPLWSWRSYAAAVDHWRAEQKKK